MPSPYSQPLRQYSADSLGSDAYSSHNASSVPLTGPQGYYGSNGPPCECSLCSLYLLVYMRGLCLGTVIYAGFPL